MIIRSLKLHNYRRFVNCIIEFPEGIVGLVGNNGAGKSTVIEAIAWVLYGTEAARSGKDEIRRTGAPSGEECFVEMDFEIDNESYRIFRNIRGKNATSDAEFYSGKKLMAKSTRAVNTEVKKVLGLELRNFQISFFARQKELNALSDLRPAERRAHIIRLLGIDAVEEAIASLRRDKNDNTSKKEIYTRTAKDITVTKDTIEEYSDKIKNSEARIEKGKEYIRQADAIRQESRAKFERISKTREQYLQLKTQGERLRAVEESYNANLKELQEKLSSLESKKAEMEKLKTQLRGYEEVKAEKERYDKLQSDYKMAESFKKNRDKLLSDRDDLEKEIASYREVVADYDNIVESLASAGDKLTAVKNEIEDKRNAATDIRSRIRSLTDKRSELELQLNNIEELGPDSKCDRCLRPMGDDYQSIHNHLTGEINSISASIDKLEPEIKQIQETLAVLQSEREDVESNRQKLLNKRANIQQQKKELVKYEKNLNVILQRIEESQKELSGLGEIEYDGRKHDELISEFKRLAKVRDMYLQVKATIDSLKDIPEKIKIAEARVQETSAELEDLRNRVKQLNYSESIYKELESEKDKHEKDYHKAQITFKELENDYKLLNQKMETFKNEL
ncbi:MAG: AAA family ATPase, partial [candidate division Zixibacteria bacterium]|nr:AAA family ATPase [candidate division Zixibacteria bacterium]